MKGEAATNHQISQYRRIMVSAYGQSGEALAPIIHGLRLESAKLSPRDSLLPAGQRVLRDTAKRHHFQTEYLLARHHKN